MTSTLRRDLIGVFVLGLIVNGLAARFVSQPGYMDAYYYFGGAVQLARGAGFNEPYLWNYLDPVARLPHPSHLYWMPLASLVAAPFITFAERFAGNPLPNAILFRAAQIPFVLLAALLPILTYIVARLTTPLRRHALIAALLMIFSGFYPIFWTNTETFTLYGLTAGFALLAGALGVDRASWRWLFLAGLSAGLAHLTRADGVFVLFAILLIVFWYQIIRSPSPPRSDPPLFNPWSLVLLLFALLSGYLLLMLLWFIRNLIVMGAPLAPGATRTLWLTNYDDLFNYPSTTLTLARYLAVGGGTILTGKWQAFLMNLGTLVGAQGLVVCFPFILIGLWKLRRHPLYLPMIVYGLLLFALMTFVFTFPGARGGLFHSGAALLPFFFPAALLGLDASVDAVARYLPHWQPEKSKPVFSGLLAAFAAALTLIIFQIRVIGPDWRHPLSAQANQAYAEIGNWLATQGESQAIVATGNPPGFYYFTNSQSIVIPNGEVNDLLQAMSAFRAHWAVLEFNHPKGLEDLYTSPLAEPRLQLRATFKDNTGQPVYLFEFLQTSDLGLRTLDFGLRTSDFGLWTSDFGLWTSDFGLQTSDFGLQTSDFGLQTSDFGLQTSDF
jgi:hypothetical protein